MKNSYINKIGQVIQPKDLENTMDEINAAIDRAMLYPTPVNADKGKYLKYDEDGNLVFDEVPGGMENPMTTEGDIIVGGASGIPSRLAKGTAGQVLKVGETGIEWGEAGGGGGGHTLTITARNKNGSHLSEAIITVIYGDGTIEDITLETDDSPTPTYTIIQNVVAFIFTANADTTDPVAADIGVIGAGATANRLNAKILFTLYTDATCTIYVTEGGN